MSASLGAGGGRFVDAAASVIAGQHDARELLAALRGGMAPPDLVKESLEAVLTHADDARMRGWARAIQKQLERVTR